MLKKGGSNAHTDGIIMGKGKQSGGERSAKKLTSPSES